jgi:hypothetical protein
LEQESAVGREPPFREDLSPEAAIIRSRYQVTTSEDTVGWKDLTCAVVICKMWKSALAL